jgi:hypothetical protein
VADDKITIDQIASLTANHPRLKSIAIDGSGGWSVEFFEPAPVSPAIPFQPQTSAPISLKRSPRDVLREYRNPPGAINGDDDPASGNK